MQQFFVGIVQKSRILKGGHIHFGWMGQGEYWNWMGQRNCFLEMFQELGLQGLGQDNQSAAMC